MVFLGMPKCFKIGGYTVYFWADDGSEPIHVHVSKKTSSNATKIWLLSDGNVLLCHNKSRIKRHELNNIMEIVRMNYRSIVVQWCTYFSCGARFYI